MTSKTRLFSIFFLLTFAVTSYGQAARKVSDAAPTSATQWSPIELSFTASQPLAWRAFPLQVTFAQGQQKLQLDAYWDGGNVWKVRFAPPLAGEWRYTTVSADASLNNLAGVIRASAPTPEQLRSNANYRGQIKVGANGHHFTYADNTPVLILADCQLFTRWPLHTFQSIIAKRKEQGFNGLNVRLAKAGEQNEAGAPYLDKKVDQLNAAFFQSVDARMKALWGAGFVTFFMPDFLGQGVYTMQDARDVSRYMLARYAAFNVAYIITGEYDNFRRNIDFWDRYEPWHELGNYIKTVNDKAYKVPLGVHPLNASSGKISHDQPWLDYNQIQSKLWKEFDTVPLAVLSDFRRTPAKPTFYAEGIYENQPWAGDLGADWHVRHQTWVPLTCGATVVDYGEHHVKGGDVSAEELAKCLDAPGARQAVYALRFMQQLEWWKHAPEREWVLVNGQVPPLAEPKKSTALPYLLADPGKSYVLYLMRGLQDAQLTLTHLDKKLYRARWFDPRTGRAIEINGGEPVNTEARDEWAIPKRPAPAEEDWVLWLTAGQEVTTGKQLAGVEDKTYFSKANNQEIKIKVYTPPGYATGKARYPVVYNLHGGGGSPERQWGRVGATLADAMENKRVRPMIYVFAEGLGNTLFVDTAGTKKQVETTVIKELIPFIDANYRTVAAREGRAIDGFSMGGFGAMHFAFKYPEVFSSVVAYGGALLTYDTLSARDKKENFGDSREYFNENNPWAWAEKNAAQIREMVKVRMVIGTKDWLYERNREFKAHLDKLKIPVSYQEIEGEEHCTKCLYEKAGLESLKFMEQAFTTPGKGNLQDREYFSKVMNRPMRYKIYTPPQYESHETSKRRYPVVYNLHGAGGGTPDRQWDRTHKVIIDAMDNARVRPMIYVFVDGLGSTMWADTFDGKRLAATTFVNELIPHVDATYRTIAAKQGRAVDGFSMGGFGALMLSMKHPELFSSAVSYGAAVVTFERMSAGIKRDAFGDNAEHFAKFDPRAHLARNADAVRKGVRVRMVCGTKDDLYPANLDFKALLEQSKIPLSWQAVEDVGHDTKGLYHAVGLESLQFIAAGFESAAPPRRERVLLDVDLSKNGAGKAKVSGGKFVAGGWTPVNPTDHLEWLIPQGRGAGPGYALVEIRNLNPTTQALFPKNQFINIDEKVGVPKTESNVQIRLRMGKNYKQFKVETHDNLAPRWTEQPINPLLKPFDEAHTYQFRVEWDEAGFRVLVDGVQAFEMETPMGGIARLQIGDEWTRGAFSGPVYTRVKVVTFGAEKNARR
jgi:enterochelin esterase-like enzyme